MSCYHPLKAMDLGLKDNGKKDIRICGSRSIPEYYIDNQGVKRFDFLSIPCGKCVGCRLDYAKNWAIRCVLESSFYSENYFLTLTYDDAHNPGNLLKDDFRSFIKKLRTYLSRKGLPDVRFFASGEYGSKNYRPHFHAIIFNLHLDDLKLVKSNLYSSDFLNHIWNKGFVVVGDVNFNSCGYVARYCLKSLNDHELFTKLGYNKEFVLMSRRPGIGFGFFDKNFKDIYNYDKIYFNFGDKVDCSVPKYFDYLFNKIDPGKLEQIKDLRRFKASLNSFNESLNTSLSESEYLNVKEQFKINQINVLRCRDV